MKFESVVRRALQIKQHPQHPLFLFAMTANEILRLCDVSRVSRDPAGKLIGYQRPEVKKHIEEIVEYLNSEDVLFPNSIILALSSEVRFKSSRGPKISDGLAVSGTLEIPLPNGGGKPAWIVDGQQRAFALSRSSRADFPVPVSGFIADTVALQRDQFLRVNNTKPLPRGLVTELLPEVSTPLPPKLALRKIPSELCDLLNRSEDSPFQGMIKRASTPKEERKQAVITDTALVNAIQTSLTSTSGCLFPYRNFSTNETDHDGIWAVLTVYWGAVKEVFEEAWGLPSTKSRLMHGAGIVAMGRLMDRVMSSFDPTQEGASDQVVHQLQGIAPFCRWTKGEWEDLGMRWNEIQNVPRHVRLLSNFLIRKHVETRQSR